MPVTTILITGASSGIGAALARRYAAPGIQLILWGRDPSRLETTAQDCRNSGATVETAAFDLMALDDVVARLQETDERQPLDLAIFNAGLGGSLRASEIAQDRLAAERMAMVNFTMPVIGANLLADRMARRRRGRIALIGSVADTYPLPMAPVYVATKAGLGLFADALDLRLAPYGVGVSLIVPGFVDTPMSQGLSEPRPFLMSAEAAATIIVRRLARGARHIVLPWQFAVIRALSRVLPRSLIRMVFRIAWRWNPAARAARR